MAKGQPAAPRRSDRVTRNPSAGVFLPPTRGREMLPRGKPSAGFRGVPRRFAHAGSGPGRRQDRSTANRLQRIVRRRQGLFPAVPAGFSPEGFVAGGPDPGGATQLELPPLGIDFPVPPVLPATVLPSRRP